MSKSKPNILNPKEELFDAVILIEESAPYFNIITANTPHCLLPLVNTPIIFYTILQLIHAKFRYFKIFCGIHRKKIKEFFATVKFKDFTDDKCKFEFIDNNIKTPADAIRYLDSQMFDKTFLLLHGDIVTDVDYLSLMKAFQLERSKNPNLIMSQILSTELPPELQLCSKSIDYTLVDKTTNVLIANEQSDMHLDIPTNSIVLTNRCDPQLYICSNKIPLRFSDQLDCITMDDMITTVISHAEVVPDEIHIASVDSKCYRVRDLNTYNHVSRQLIRGQLKRLSPYSIYGDNVRAVSASGTILTNHSSCYISRKLRDDFISSSSKLVGNVFIQNGTRVGDNCRLHDSIVGNNCSIGNNVTLRNCFLMSDVTIDNNCTISDSFLCSGSVVNSNCLISDKSIIDHNFSVKPETKCEATVLSGGGEIENFWNAVVMEKKKPTDLSIGVDEIDLDHEEADNTVLFAQDFHLLLKEASEEAMTIDNLFIETNRLKHQYALGIEDVCFGLMDGFVNYFFKEKPTDGKKFREHFVQLLERYGELITRYNGDSAVRVLSCLEAVEECACYNSDIMAAVLDIFFSLYEEDIVSETDIMKWYNSSSLLGDDELTEKTEEIRDNLSKLITFFEEAEEESD